MDSDAHKKVTIQAKRQIRGEAFFEALVSDYCLPHRIVSPKDVGIDYICEWVYGDRPTGILFAVQVKALSERTAKPRESREVNNLNALSQFRISNRHLAVDEKTLHYWKGLGMPTYLFAVVQSTDGAVLDCYYKRFTTVLTTEAKQEDFYFYKVNKGIAFLAFAQPKQRCGGFARDLFIDYMRWSYCKGTITYLNPRTIGLNQFPDEDAVFADILPQYMEQVCTTYRKTKDFLEQHCGNAEGE